MEQETKIDQMVTEMPDILQDFPISAKIEDVFRGVSTPVGLDQWWTAKSAGKPAVGEEYSFWFAPEYDWRGVVTKCTFDREIEWRMTHSDSDWTGSLVGFALERKPEFTWVRFYHIGWPAPNDHYRISSHCWAMYLRILRRFLEHGETVPYEKRLSV